MCDTYNKHGFLVKYFNELLGFKILSWILTASLMRNFYLKFIHEQNDPTVLTSFVPSGCFKNKNVKEWSSFQ